MADPSKVEVKAKDGKYVYVCKTCGKEFGSEGAYNFHGPCGPGWKGRKKAGENQPGQKKDPPPGGGCPECGGRTRFLNKNRGPEERALEDGYKEVCTKCGELV